MKKESEKKRSWLKSVNITQESRQAKQEKGTEVGKAFINTLEILLKKKGVTLLEAGKDKRPNKQYDKLFTQFLTAQIETGVEPKDILESIGVALINGVWKHDRPSSERSAVTNIKHKLNKLLTMEARRNYDKNRANIWTGPKENSYLGTAKNKKAQAVKKWTKNRP